MNDIKMKYFMWMVDIALNERMRQNLSYDRLLWVLFNKDFEYLLPMDENRYVDGVNLRYRFARENGISNREFGTQLDNCPCSILEMMLALSLRIEEEIMANDAIGDRTWKWFWEMIVNLGLGQMTDDHFDAEYVQRVCDRFLRNDYERNGKGGLFTIYHRKNDMRNVEIWYQAMWHLNELDDM